MRNNVSFATTNSTNTPNKPSEFTQAEWDAYNSSKFNGLPFPTIEKDEQNKAFSNWDGTTKFQGIPSESDSKRISVLGDHYSYKFTYDQIFKLFWRMKKSKVVLHKNSDKQLTTDETAARDSSYDLDEFATSLTPTSSSNEKDLESQLIEQLSTNYWKFNINGCGLGIDFTLPVLKTGQDEYRPFVECGCCAPCYDVWQISASQSLVGYAGFTCEDLAPSDSRYLKYNVSCSSGFTGGQCGGGAQPAEKISVTTEIDSFTGLSCTKGLPTNGYTCGGGTDCKESCTETNKTYTCNARPEDCAGEGVDTIETSYSLSEPNTIENVISRTDSLLNSFDENSLPRPNTSGTVKVGSGGESTLAWQIFSGQPSASRQTSRGVAELIKSVVKLKRDSRYKIISYDENGESSEQEYDGVKDEMIYLDPPSESDGSKYFEIIGDAQRCTSIPTISDIESINQLTTKTLRVALPPPPPVEGEEPVEPESQPCTSFILGPDCKSYTTRVTTVSDSALYSDSGSSSNSFGDIISAENSGDSSSSSTTTSTACGPTTTVSTSSSSESSQTTEFGATSSYSMTCQDGKGSKTRAIGGSSTTYEFDNGTGSCVSFDCGASNCNPICGSDSRSDTSTEKEGNSTTTRTTASNCSQTPYGSSQSLNVTISTSTSAVDEYDYSGSSKQNNLCNTTTTVSYSGEVSSSFNEGDEETPPNYDTISWQSSGSLCAWKAMASNGTMNEQTADITITVSVDGDPEKDYEVKVQMIIESNITQNNCSSRSYEAYEETLTMKGGESKPVTRSLSANNGQTKCLIHHSAVAYEA